MSGKLLLLIVGILAVGAAVFPTLSSTTNCGGNSAAIAQVRSIALIAGGYETTAKGCLKPRDLRLEFLKQEIGVAGLQS